MESDQFLFFVAGLIKGKTVLDEQDFKFLKEEVNYAMETQRRIAEGE